MPNPQAKRGTTSRQGAAAVEMALVVPLLVLLMFGIVELGLMMHGFMQVRTVAREGARQASVGALPDDVESRMEATGDNLNQESIQYLMQYRTYNAGGSWGAWTTLGSDGDRNDAPSGSHVRITVTYAHPLTLPGLFGRFVDDPEHGTKTLQAEVIMRRE